MSKNEADEYYDENEEYSYSEENSLLKCEEPPLKRQRLDCRRSVE